MKQISRLFLLSLVAVFAFSSAFAQNTYMTKAQTLGLKTSSNTNVTAITHEVNSSRAVFLAEGFDVEGDFPPTGWTQTSVHATNTWEQSNPSENDFSTIDPNSIFSALTMWIAEDQDEWLITPVINAGGETPLTLDFYAGVSGPYLNPGATLICHISNDGGTTWTELWNAIDVIDPAAEWAWNFVSLDISDYAAADFQVAWQYVGNDGDLIAIDNVEISAGYEYIFEDDMEIYALNSYLAESDETGYWTTWSNNPGSAEDGIITDAQSASPTQSCIVEGSTDLVLKLGNKTSGKYQVNVEYYVPADFGGYINLQHFEAPGNEWAVEIFFGAANGDDNGYMVVDGPPDTPFTYPHDSWFPIEFIIDLDADLAQCYINSELIEEWQFSLQADGEPGTLQLGGVNFYAGAPEGETSKYYFDNVEYIVLDPGVQNPIIDVTPSTLFGQLEVGEILEETVTITNLGQAELNYEIVTTYPQETKALDAIPTGVNTPKQLRQNPQAAPNYTPVTSSPASRDDLIHYDGDNASAIGSSADYEWRVAAMFPAEMLKDYIGMELNEVHVFINDAAIATKIQVYGMGSFNTPGPGELLLEQDFNSQPTNWTVVNLDTPIYIDGSDLWVGYWVSATGGLFTPGVDAGPANPNGDWMASGPGWGHLSNNPDLDYNWNIRANLTGEPIIQWVSTDPTSGMLVQDESIDINVTLDASGLAPDTYVAKLLVRNNDPENELVEVALTFGVTVGLTENGEQEYIAVYPNPASTVLTVKSNGNVNSVKLINTIGQVVYTSTTTSNIDVSSFNKGVYLIQVDTDNGTSTQKVVIK